ncbi:MAG: Hpt domain-containing protein [Deltaproteobacteria bacterium]|jgi:two-component system chemotaxis sensor kinase CheA|nr:Hpt domain-containing protein [Deltaproteobacteria bacterium]
MSQDFMDAELFADFIIEAKEHLETIEPNLLELEKAPGNLELLNEIFRPMHSLKGASGFLGLNKMNMLAHKCENILDALRKGDMVVTSAIMYIILASTDALRQMIDTLESTNTEGDVETEHLTDQINAIMAGETVAPAALAPGAVAEPAEKPTVEEAALPEDTHATEHIPEAPEPPAPAADAGSGASMDNASHDTAMPAMSAKEWIQTLEQLPSYKLTAFGESHLRDFIDEAREIIENLVTGLLSLEEQPQGQDELINDLFRYFHNLKGNSGIIAYQELNSLTHEAETLLNNVRRGEMVPSRELIDLLLLVVDVMEALINNIDSADGTVRPFDISQTLHQLQQAVAGEEITLPESLRGAPPSPGENVRAQSAAEPESAHAADASTPVVIPMGNEEDDLDAFRKTVQQQSEIFHSACALLEKDGNNKDNISALYRSLVAVQNACSFMKMEEARVYAERTAGIVDKARSTDMDFSLMLDLLNQEFSILLEIIEKESAKLAGAPATPPDSKLQAVPVPKPAPAAEKAPPPASAATPMPVAKPAAAPATHSAVPAPAAQPAPPAAAKPSPPPAKPAAPAGGGAGAGAHESSKASATIRVDHEKLDHLMNLIGELNINRNRYTLIARQLEGSGEEKNINEIAQSLSETTYAMARISDDLQDTIMKVRMVPVSSVFSRFPRLVRDLSRKSGKEVDLVVEGDETELDKSVVEVIGDPLVHLIRNSVDHGVEHEADRIAKGKPAKGKVVLRAYHKGNSVAIEIEDDGNGIDPEKMREVAVRKGILSAEEARQLDDREATELIFAPGFSSSEVITDISGRGVGMDVVRTNIKNLKGSVSISTEVGKGTRFTLSLPLTLAIIDALMVNVSGEMYAIPLDAVSETTKIESARLTDMKGRKAVTLRGEVLGIVELAEMLVLPKSYEELPEVLSVVVIHDNERRLGLVVDRLLERQEIVIKPLGAYLGDLKGISGATIMGDGSVILILDPHEIYLMATSKGLG